MSLFQTVSRFGTTIASAATIVIPVDGDFFTISGTTTITALTTAPVGAPARAVGSIFRLRFTGAAPLTHNATSLILADAANYTPQVGEVLTFEVVASGQVREHGARYRAPYFPVRSVTTTYSIIDSDAEISCSGASFTVTLPSASGRAGKEFEISKPLADSSVNIITISGTIDGSTTRKLYVGGSRLKIRSDGTNWRIVLFEVPGAVPIAYAATITPDASLIPRQSGIFATTMTAAMTVAAPLTPTDGQEMEFVWTVSGTGPYTVTWNTVFAFNTTYPQPTLSSASGKIDRIKFKYNAAVSKWQCTGYALGS